MSTRQRVLVYGDVDMNLIDGSAIWAQSTALAFAAAGCDVTFLCKAQVKTDRLLAPLDANSDVRVADPFEESLLPGIKNALSPQQVGKIAALMDAEQRFDVVVLRGLRVVRQFIDDNLFGGRLWTYLTDIVQDLAHMDADHREALGKIAEHSRYLLCQTEEFRTYLDSIVPTAVGKTVLFPPVLPASPATRTTAPAEGRVRLAYSGKFAPLWNTMQMTALPTKLREAGVRAELIMIGDKVHEDPEDPDYQQQMKRALLESYGVSWLGGMSRVDAMKKVASAHIGMSWRHPGLDASLELSTKVLEYGLLGLPAVLSPTPAHAHLLGADYPLFASSEAEVVDVIRSAVRDPGRYEEAARRCAVATEEHTQERATERILTYLRRAFPEVVQLRGRSRPLRLGVASHDLKFFTRMLDYFKNLPEVEVRVDDWAALADHDPERSAELAEWADVIVCEWCGPNAAWYSMNKREGQRLVVRLHRFELYSPYWRKVQIEAVDEVVCVSPYYADLTREITGWPPEKIVTIPNWVDVLSLDRPKYEGAQFHLGFIGLAPARKRFDTAIEVLSLLLEEDPRYVLSVKSQMPWQYWWIWKKAEEQRHFADILERIQSEPVLRGAVTFDGFGPDVGSWLRKIGSVLSTSDDESFHLSPAEGMASGAVPVIGDWAGGDTIYDPRWIHKSPEDMAKAVLALREGATWEAEGRKAKAQVAASYSLERVCDLWGQFVVDGHVPAR